MECGTTLVDAAFVDACGLVCSKRDDFAAIVAGF